MHNIVHNMTDDLGVSNHLTIRNGVCQYVRRVPEDLRLAFPFARIQQSLRTRDQRKARAVALDLDRLWDGRFAEARRARGLSAGEDGPACIGTDDWSWPDWQALATWFGASLAEEDWRARLASVVGGTLGPESDPRQLPWCKPEIVQEHIARGKRLRAITVADYAAARLGFVQGCVRRLGIALTRTHPEHERFMAACLKAELGYLDVFAQREARRGGLDQPHPDLVEGPWRRIRPTAPADTTDPRPVASSSPSSDGARAGKTLA